MTTLHFNGNIFIWRKTQGYQSLIAKLEELHLFKNNPSFLMKDKGKQGSK
jgi:hypothetical protein